MSDAIEAFGSLTFPSQAALKNWLDADIAPAARRAVTKLVGTPEEADDEAAPDEGSVRALFDAFASERDVLVAVAREGAVARVAFWLDEALWLEHGQTLFAALATAAAHGGEGEVHVVAAGSGRVFHQLVVGGGKASTRRVTKRLAARDVEGHAAFARAIERWRSG